MKKSFLITLLMFLLVFYIREVVSHATAFNDLWMLNKILPYFVLITLNLFILSYFILRSPFSYSIFTSILTISIMVVTPLIKFKSPLAIYGPYDPLAHYSFSKWILINGRIPQHNKLYYSFEYGYHPGNGLIPTFVSLISNISLDATMTLILLVGYAVYIMTFIVLMRSANIKVSPLIMLFSISVLYFSPTFTGTRLSYSFIGILLLILFKLYLKQLSFDNSVLVLLTIFYTSLILTHFSSSVHIAGLFLLYIILLSKEKITKKYVTVLLSLTLILILYELFTDIHLFEDTFTEAIAKLKKLYLRENVELKQALIEHKNLSLLQIIGFFIASRGKPTILLFLSIVIWGYQTLEEVRRKKSNKRMKNSEIEGISTFKSNTSSIYVLLSITLILYGISYLGVGSLMGAVRVVPLIQPFLALLIISSVRSRICEGKFLVALIIPLILIGFMSNYHLGFLSPTLEYRGEIYRISFSVPISFYIYTAVDFSNNFSSSYIKFVTLSPYITFGYTDLAWNIDKFPYRGFISAGITPEDAESIIKMLINKNKDIIIPLYLTDKLSGRLGLRSYYLRPFELLTYETILIYNNGNYALFYY